MCGTTRLHGRICTGRVTVVRGDGRVGVVERARDVNSRDKMTGAAATSERARDDVSCVRRRHATDATRAHLAGPRATVTPPDPRRRAHGRRGPKPPRAARVAPPAAKPITGDRRGAQTSRGRGLRAPPAPCTAAAAAATTTDTTRSHWRYARPPPPSHRHNNDNNTVTPFR